MPASAGRMPTIATPIPSSRHTDPSGRYHDRRSGAHEPHPSCPASHARPPDQAAPARDALGCAAVSAQGPQTGTRVRPPLGSARFDRAGGTAPRGARASAGGAEADDLPADRGDRHRRPGPGPVRAGSGGIGRRSVDRATGRPRSPARHPGGGRRGRRRVHLHRRRRRRTRPRRLARPSRRAPHGRVRRSRAAPDPGGRRRSRSCPSTDRRPDRAVRRHRSAALERGHHAAPPRRGPTLPLGPVGAVSRRARGVTRMHPGASVRPHRGGRRPGRLRPSRRLYGRDPLRRHRSRKRSASDRTPRHVGPPRPGLVLVRRSARDAGREAAKGPPWNLGDRR